MIYESVGVDQPIRQDDFFRRLPRADVSLARLVVLARNAEDETIEHREMSWEDALQSVEVHEFSPE
jgi:hypothetical protein